MPMLDGHRSRHWCSSTAFAHGSGRCGTLVKRPVVLDGGARAAPLAKSPAGALVQTDTEEGGATETLGQVKPAFRRPAWRLLRCNGLMACANGNIRRHRSETGWTAGQGDFASPAPAVVYSRIGITTYRVLSTPGA